MSKKITGATAGDPGHMPSVNPMLTPGKKAWHKGRAAVSQDGGESAVLQARVGKQRLAKYQALGGANWLRNTIDIAVLPCIGPSQGR